MCHQNWLKLKTYSKYAIMNQCCWKREECSTLGEQACEHSNVVSYCFQQHLAKFVLIWYFDGIWSWSTGGTAMYKYFAAIFYCSCKPHRTVCINLVYYITDVEQPYEIPASLHFRFLFSFALQVLKWERSRFIYYFTSPLYWKWNPIELHTSTYSHQKNGIACKLKSA